MDGQRTLRSRRRREESGRLCPRPEDYAGVVARSRAESTRACQRNAARCGGSLLLASSTSVSERSRYGCAAASFSRSSYETASDCKMSQLRRRRPQDSAPCRALLESLDAAQVVLARIGRGALDRADQVQELIEDGVQPSVAGELHAASRELESAGEVVAAVAHPCALQQHTDRLDRQAQPAGETSCGVKLALRLSEVPSLSGAPAQHASQRELPARVLAAQREDEARLRAMAVAVV